MGFNKRQAPRMDHKKRVLLQFSRSLGFVGYTRDISKTGAYVELAYPTEGIRSGSRGIYRIMSFRDKYAYRFHVIRLDGMGMAIEFLSPPDDFVIQMLREP